jgi:hypothetical protein
MSMDFNTQLPNHFSDEILLNAVSALNTYPDMSNREVTYQQTLGKLINIKDNHYLKIYIEYIYNYTK